jgi:hypothetical protein
MSVSPIYRLSGAIVALGYTSTPDTALTTNNMLVLLGGALVGHAIGKLISWAD